MVPGHGPAGRWFWWPLRTWSFRGFRRSVTDSGLHDTYFGLVLVSPPVTPRSVEIAHLKPRTRDFACLGVAARRAVQGYDLRRCHTGRPHGLYFRSAARGWARYGMCAGPVTRTAPPGGPARAARPPRRPP